MLTEIYESEENHKHTDTKQPMSPPKNEILSEGYHNQKSKPLIQPNTDDPLDITHVMKTK